MEFRPVPWKPPRSPGLTGEFAPNDRLAAAELWPVGGHGPEDVVVDAAGAVWAGLDDGRIVRFGPGGGEPETVASTGGRPLGLELWPGGGLVICDARRGLLRLDPAGGIETLVESVDGRPLLFTNNAAVAADGTIYFTDTSRRWGIERYRLDLFEGSATGRLLLRRPDGAVETVLDGLAFANGVALGPEERFLVVAETGAYRLRRLWLSGPRAGEDETFADNLPGFPDNLSFDGETFWLALPSLRDAMLDRIRTHPWLAHLVARLPEAIQPGPKRHGFVLGFDPDGRVAWNLQDPSGRVAIVTGARRAGGKLYLGSLSEPAVAVVDLPAAGS